MAESGHQCNIEEGQGGRVCKEDAGGEAGLAGEGGGGLGGEPDEGSELFGVPLRPLQPTPGFGTMFGQELQVCGGGGEGGGVGGCRLLGARGEGWE